MKARERREKTPVTGMPNACWVLNRRQSRAFAEALLTPPEPNAVLREAAARYRRLVKAAAPGDQAYGEGALGEERKA